MDGWCHWKHVSVLNGYAFFFKILSWRRGKRKQLYLLFIYYKIINNVCLRVLFVFLLQSRSIKINQSIGATNPNRSDMTHFREDRTGDVSKFNQPRVSSLRVKKPSWVERRFDDSPWQQQRRGGPHTWFTTHLNLKSSCAHASLNIFSELKIKVTRLLNVCWRKPASEQVMSTEWVTMVTD